MHVLPVMPRVLDISAVVVGSNTSMDAVKQGVSPGSPSTAVVRCKLTSNLSIFSWKKRENVSQPSTIEQNSTIYDRVIVGGTHEATSEADVADVKENGEQRTAVKTPSRSRWMGGRQHESEGSVQRSRRHIRRQQRKLHFPKRDCR